jgi:formate/nitrite transporter FocA (FNT family)
MGTASGNAVSEMIVTIAEAKTIGYEALGASGLALVFLKAILCNWMVTLGAVLAFSSTSTGGKILAMWLPVTTFFALGFEHAVVNMFVIPAGIVLGADVTVAGWWLWNQLPVLLGNVIGALALTAAPLYASHRTRIRRGQRVERMGRLSSDADSQPDAGGSQAISAPEPSLTTESETAGV